MRAHLARACACGRAEGVPHCQHRVRTSSAISHPRLLRIGWPGKCTLVLLGVGTALGARDESTNMLKLMQDRRIQECSPWSGQARSSVPPVPVPGWLACGHGAGPVQRAHVYAPGAWQASWSARACCWRRERAWAPGARAAACCTRPCASPRCPAGRTLALLRSSCWLRIAPRQPTGKARTPIY